MHFLTSLRGIAAMLVVFYHIKVYLFQHHLLQDISFLFSQGYLAVDFFFILSGFILSYKYSPSFVSSFKENYSVFLKARIARIAPLHIFMLFLFVTIPFAHFSTGREINNIIYSFDSFIVKFFLLDSWFINSSYFNTWNVPSWTISAELFAYISFPLIIFYLQKLNIKVKFLIFNLCMLLIILLFNKFNSNSIGDNIGFLGIFRCFFEFWMGSFIFFLYDKTKLVPEYYFKYLFFLSITILILCLNFFDKNYYYIPVLFSVLLYSLLGFKSPIHSLLSTKPLIYLGEISYSIYLSHIFLRDFMTMLFSHGQPLNYMHLCLFITIVIVFSIMTYEFIEVPARRYLRSAKLFKSGS